MGLDRIPRIPQTTGDATISNNVLTIIGLGGLYIQNNGTPGGIFFVDQNGIQAQCLPFGGDLSGTPDRITVVQVNGGTPINQSQVAARIHARQ